MNICLLFFLITQISQINTFADIIKFPGDNDFDPNTFQLDNITILYSKPDIKQYYNIVTDKEVDYLIEEAKKRVKPSFTMGGYITEIRDSSSAFLENDYTDEILLGIRKRFAALVGYEENHIEHLQVVHYKDQQYYKPHYDYYGPEINKAYLADNCGNDREHTFLLYLNTIPKKYGGFTKFINLGIKSQPKRRMALYFQNIAKNGTYFSNTLHSGWRLFQNKNLEKWALNVWIRQHNLRESEKECINNFKLYNEMELDKWRRFFYINNTRK